MAGPWDNVTLPGPPNGPAWAQAAAQLMGATQNSINSGANAFQNWQNFNYQQNQREFFQDPQNKALLQQALQTNDPVAASNARSQLMQGLIQAGGTSTAQQMMPQILQQPFRDLYLKRLQNQDNSGNDEQQPVSAGPATSPHAAGPENIVPKTSNTTPRIGYGEGPSFNDIVSKSGANVPDQVAQNIVRSVGASSTEDALTEDQAGRAQVRLNQYLKRNGGNTNPVPQSGTGEQESAGNELNPSMGPGGPAMTPRQTGERRTAQAATVQAEGSFNDRFAPTGVTRSGAEAMVPPGANPEAYARAKLARAAKLREDAKIGKFAGFDTSEDEKQAEALDKEGHAILEQLGKGSAPSDKMKEAAASRMSPLEYEAAQKRNELRQTEFVAKNKGIQAADRAAAESDDDMRAMRGILNDPKLFTMAGNELVSYLRGGLINAGLMDPNARLPNEALKKVTSKALQAQMDQMKDEAAAIGGSAGRIMLAQVNIMKDAAQNIEMSPSGLRYLTELMERSNQRTHEIAQLARDYNRRNGGRGLDDGFDQQLADYSRTHPMMTGQEIENHHLLSSPHLPSELEGAGASKIAQWAHGHGLKKGDPIRVPSNEPPGYEYRFSP